MMDRYYIETFGCTLNVADSEIIKNLMENANLEPTSSIDDAKLIVINTCGVKSPTEQKIMHRIKTLEKHDDKKIIVTGCLPLIYKHDIERITSLAKNIMAIIGPRNYHEIPDILTKINDNKTPILRISGGNLSIKENLEQKTSKGIIAIIPIAEGCTGSCTYCCTKFARGKLFSFSSRSILKKLDQWLNFKKKEIWITAEDCSAYQDFSTKTKLPGLLNKIAKKNDKSFFIRVGMMNPRTLFPIQEQLIDVLQSEKMFKFIHVPVQSGSNRVLKLMNRLYDIETFEEMINSFKKSIPRITLATDAICGFPGESEEDFNHTLNLIKRIKPDIINISMYGHRPGTKASKMKQLNSNIVKQRTKQLTSLFKEIAIKNNEKWIGWKGIAIIDEFNEKKGNFIARNQYYKPIVIKDGKIGDFIITKITGAKTHYLQGTLLEKINT
ncbi:MAG: tRNA (N(6)-L-threonylcarbamoyladenosine(37)-C(2))-methylthiotransferase [Promethearchaeota archaeon]